MEKLYSHFKSLSFILICSANAAQGMELTMPTSQITVNPLTEVPSLKSLCLDYIGQNAQQVNLIDNLINLPDELAVESLLHTEKFYIDHNKATLTKLALSNSLGSSVSSTIAQITGDIELAHKLAKNGPITNDVATMIVGNFLATDATTCFGDFTSAFNKAFPKEILGHGNDNRLYRIVKNIITDIHCEGDWKTNDAAIFSVQDFEHKTPINNVANYAASKYFKSQHLDACTHNQIALSSCGTLLAFPQNQMRPIIKIYMGPRYQNWQDLYTVFEIHNLKNGHKIIITAPKKGECVGKIVFNKDRTHFGLLDEYGDIHSINITPIVLGDVSLEKIAPLAQFMSFLKSGKHLNSKLAYGEGILSHKWENLITDIESFPVYIDKEMKRMALTNGHVRILANLFTHVSEPFSMTKQEMMQLFLDQDQEFFIKLFTFISDNGSETMKANARKVISFFGFNFLI